MATTRTAGITIDGFGRRTINKEYRGLRVFLRLGAVCQEHAERRLVQEIERLEWEVERRAHGRPLFSDCCNRFLAESNYKRTKATIAWHVTMLLPHVGSLDVRKVHDDTLRPFVDTRLIEGVSSITINRTLEVARAILNLNRAARAYRDADGAAKLPDVRVHDLRHTFGTRLRAAGVTAEDRAALLGHSLGTMPEHYASADIGRLVGLANRVLIASARQRSCALQTADMYRQRNEARPSLVDKGSRKSRAGRPRIWFCGPKPFERPET